MTQTQLNPNCKCPYNCSNHGNCVACKAKHAKDGSPTFCVLVKE